MSAFWPRSSHKNGIVRPAKRVVIEAPVVAVSVMLAFGYLQKPHDLYTSSSNSVGVTAG